MEQFGSLREGVNVNIQRSDGNNFHFLFKIHVTYLNQIFIEISQAACIKPLLLNCIRLRIASQSNGASAMKQKEKKSSWKPYYP